MLTEQCNSPEIGSEVQKGRYMYIVQGETLNQNIGQCPSERIMSKNTDGIN